MNGICNIGNVTHTHYIHIMIRIYWTNRKIGISWDIYIYKAAETPRSILGCWSLDLTFVFQPEMSTGALGDWKIMEDHGISLYIYV